MPDDIHENQPAGIFIPYEKLLEQINDKLDKIVDKLDAKLDSAVFESFRTSYEQRHENLAGRTKQLEDDKVKRDAVTDYKTYVKAGAGLGGIAIFLDTAFVVARMAGWNA